MKSKTVFIVLLNHSGRLRTSGKHFCLEMYFEKIHDILRLSFVKTALLNLSVHQALSNQKPNKLSLRIVFDSIQFFIFAFKEKLQAHVLCQRCDEKLNCMSDVYRIAASLHMFSEFSLEVETCLNSELPTQCLCDGLAESQWEKLELKYQFQRAWSGYNTHIFQWGLRSFRDFQTRSSRITKAATFQLLSSII